MSKRSRRRMIRDFVSDVRSGGTNPDVRRSEGRRGIKSKGGYFIPTREGFGNPYATGKRRRDR